MSRHPIPVALAAALLIAGLVSPGPGVAAPPTGSAILKRALDLHPGDESARKLMRTLEVE